MADSHHGDVLATMRNGVFSDLTFVCKQRSFQVHKALVCAQSDKLYSDIESAQVTRSGAIEIDMSEFQPETVESFVNYLYTGEYSRVIEELASELQPDDVVLAEILSHLQAHHIAFRYEVDRMMSLSLSNLQSLLEKYKGKKSLVSALPSAARVAYSLTIGHDVKDSLAASFAWHLPSLAGDRFPDIYTIPEFFELVLYHCARKIASHKDIASTFDKRLQALTIKNAQDSMAANEALQLIRDRKHCVSQSCRAGFNVQVSNTCEVTCRLCLQKQNLTPGAAVSLAAPIFASRARNPFRKTKSTQDTAPKPVIFQASNSTPVENLFGSSRRSLFSARHPDLVGRVKQKKRVMLSGQWDV
ncbi:hypothetical protein BB8028_0007g02650 [Beauveria bassiana]|uniref:BTB domain-containing protein n=2 Tax=Beauveria bassiana TaxID=176275 RepID=A0A0A2W263_BEABA|nr:hypothetical protein BBAD15_g7594 [Beauveria bassiana D1-5]PQK17066.1 hypothetical protein BB8028_0007g02650 [Beauveria bassiana]